VRADPKLRRQLDEAWRLLDTHGHAAAVVRLRQRLDTQVGVPPSVVVVGETKRGKSSLVNALLGADVAAVGVEVATSAYVAYVPTSVEHPLAPGRARVELADGDHLEVGLDELDDWVTVTGRHAAAGAEVVGAVARVPTEGVLPVVLVDTPGVGGLRAAHRRLALRAAGEAAALLFVTDAGSDLTAPELGFLAEVAGDVGTVVVAVTKIDKDPYGWETTVGQLREALAAAAPRLASAPVVGVSSLQAAEARTADDPAIAQALAEEARLAQLVAVLTARVSARADTLAVVNAAQATAAALRCVTADLEERVAAIRDPGDPARPVEDVQRELQDLGKQRQRWGRTFDVAVQRSRRRLAEEAVRSTAELEHAWRHRLTELSTRELRQEPQRAAVLESFSDDVVHRAAALYDGLLAELATVVTEALPDDAARRRVLEEHLGVPSTVVAEAAAGPGPVLGAAQPLAQHLLRGGLMGMGMSGMVTVLAGAGAALAPPLVAGVIGAGAAMGWRNRDTAEAERVRAVLREHVGRTVQRAQQALSLRADGLLGDLRERMAQAMEEHFEQRAAQLNEVLREQKEAARAAPVERARRAQPLQRELNAVAAAAGELEASARELMTVDATGPGRPPAPVTGATPPSGRGW
jgi:hypothetical protein